MSAPVHLPIRYLDVDGSCVGRGRRPYMAAVGGGVVRTGPQSACAVESALLHRLLAALTCGISASGAVAVW